MPRVAALALVAALAAVANSARADDAADFMQRFSGDWLGTGQLLIGSDNGLKFNCELSGDPSRTQLTFGMSGKCWMGMLSAPVYAQLRYNSETNRFYGAFMGGAANDGVDIVGVRAGEGFALQLSAGTAQGRIKADAVNANQLVATLYYRDPSSKAELPVVAMGFTRKGTGDALPAYLPDVVTGSIGNAGKDAGATVGTK